GCLSAPEGGSRGRPDAARPPEEPPRAGPRRSVSDRELRRAAADNERACRRRQCACGRRADLARARGTRAVRSAHDQTLTIGLTGPIGCGKSTVAGWLAERRARSIDADAIAREVTAPGTPCHDAVLGRFGDPVRTSDGTLDRSALARIVFADADALGSLERIVHPPVRPRV